MQRAPRGRARRRRDERNPERLAVPLRGRGDAAREGAGGAVRVRRGARARCSSEGERSAWWAERERDAPRGRRPPPAGAGPAGDRALRPGGGARRSCARRGRGRGRARAARSSSRARRGSARRRLVDAFLQELDGRGRPRPLRLLPALGRAGRALRRDPRALRRGRTWRRRSAPYLDGDARARARLRGAGAARGAARRARRRSRATRSTPSSCHLMRGLAAEKPLALGRRGPPLRGRRTAGRSCSPWPGRVEGHRVLLLLDDPARAARGRAGPLQPARELPADRARAALARARSIQLLRDAFRSEALAEKLGGEDRLQVGRRAVLRVRDDPGAEGGAVHHGAARTGPTSRRRWSRRSRCPPRCGT